jgi:putative hydrolase of the HAD superfamily
MKPRAIFFDFGDTLADEASQVWDARPEIVSAELLPEAVQLVKELARRGYPLALVADCVPGTGGDGYDRVLTQHGIRNAISVITDSDEVGAEKPDARMFWTTFEKLSIARADASRVMMVGNNIERDVAGANRLGMLSVWLKWSPRYRLTPESADEHAKFVITSPLKLLPIIDDLERQH